MLQRRFCVAFPFAILFLAPTVCGQAAEEAPSRSGDTSAAVSDQPQTAPSSFDGSVEQIPVVTTSRPDDVDFTFNNVEYEFIFPNYCDELDCNSIDNNLLNYYKAPSSRRRGRGGGFIGNDGTSETQDPNQDTKSQVDAGDGPARLAKRAIEDRPWSVLEDIPSLVKEHLQRLEEAEKEGTREGDKGDTKTLANPAYYWAHPKKGNIEINPLLFAWLKQPGVPWLPMTRAGPISVIMSKFYVPNIHYVVSPRMFYEACKIPTSPTLLRSFATSLEPNHPNHLIGGPEWFDYMFKDQGEQDRVLRNMVRDHMKYRLNHVRNAVEADEKLMNLRETLVIEGLKRFRGGAQRLWNDIYKEPPERRRYFVWSIYKTHPKLLLDGSDEMMEKYDWSVMTRAEGEALLALMEELSGRVVWQAWATHQAVVQLFHDERYEHLRTLDGYFSNVPMLEAQTSHVLHGHKVAIKALTIALKNPKTKFK